MRSHVIPGEQVDNFRIDELVSSTPVASIFRGTDLQTRKPVLMKFPNPDVETDPVLSNRFKREEEISSSLNHPGLLKALEGAAHSRPYIVSQWFDGQLLRQLLNTEKKLPQERAVRIALNISEVLNYVEGHGVFHRDLRPENIMVGADDSVKLINFGAAAMVGARRITFTTVSQAVGISDYLAPEELRGRRGDARGDVYSLGVILYEILTGQTPFQGIDPFSRERIHPFENSARTEQQREMDASIFPPLEQVIYRAIEPSPARRYANAHEMARDLKHPDQVQVRRRITRVGRLRSKRVLIYATLALLPVLIFALLLLFARR